MAVQVAPRRLPCVGVTGHHRRAGDRLHDIADGLHGRLEAVLVGSSEDDER